jgi:hypothetical protein
VDRALTAYTQGVYSSRRIAKACEERVDFMAATGIQKPDFRTINAFRKRHLPALGGLFVQVLKLCRRAGLVRLGHVALDGSKFKANASKHKAMSYPRMREDEARLREEVDAWFREADEADGDEDAAFEPGQARRRAANLGRQQAQRLERILRSEGGAGAGSQGRRGQAQPRRRKWPCAQAAGEATAQLHRPRQQGHADEANLRAELQLPDRGRRRESGDRGREPQQQADEAPELPAMLTQIKTNSGRQAREL